MTAGPAGRPTDLSPATKVDIITDCRPPPSLANTSRSCTYAHSHVVSGTLLAKTSPLYSSTEEAASIQREEEINLIKVS